MTHETRENGRKAELRVFVFAQAMFGHVSLANPEQDYAGKTDLVIDGMHVQVSVSSKSKREQKSLEKRGVTPIAAGPQISDEQLREQLQLLKYR